ncbi:MAG TPA: hypothetical protein GX708_24735 [Gallicola sp.]|nr:hypothetical protein [Gallicola sp.]
MRLTYKILGLVLLTIFQSCGLKNSSDNTVINAKSNIDIFEKYSNDSIRERIFKMAYGNNSTAPSYVVFIAVDSKTGTKKEICCEAPFLSGAMHRELGKGYDELSAEYIDSLILENKGKIFMFENKESLDNINFFTYPDSVRIAKIAAQNDLDYYYKTYGANDSINSIRFDTDSGFVQETFAHIMFKCGIITSRDCIAGNYIWFGEPNLSQPKLPEIEK